MSTASCGTSCERVAFIRAGRIAAEGTRTPTRRRCAREHARASRAPAARHARTRGRETRRLLSLWTQTILPPILTAVLFLAVFGGALGRRIQRVEGIPFLSFILPGLLVMTVAGQAFAN